MGLVDDRKGLGWRLRLGVQVGLAAVLAASGVRVTLFGLGPYFGGLVTVLWVVGLTNAFNFLDNMDGLAAGVGLIAALLFAGAQVAVGSLFVPGVLLGLVGALGGFLVHNRYPARLFMGDAGSNFLGFLLGALTVAGTYYRYDRPVSPYSVLAPLLVMAVPLYDTASVILIRLREGRSPFLGDRRHFSHRLVERGLTPRQAVRTIDLVTLAGGLGALLLHRLDAVGAAVVVAQTVCLLGLVAILEVSRRHRPERRGVAMSRRNPRTGADPVDRPEAGARPPDARRRPRRPSSPPGSASGSAGRARARRPRCSTARAFWPSEPDLRADAGGGLALGARAAGRRRASRWPGRSSAGDLRFRWSWADAGVIALAALVGVSAGHAVDRRLGDQPGLGVGRVRGRLPVLVRNLPRTRGESVALLGGAGGDGRGGRGLRALPGRRRAARDPAQVPDRPGVPGRGAAGRRDRARDGRAGPVSRTGSSARTSRISTFALANSLAGFLVGPLVVMLAVRLGQPDPPRRARARGSGRSCWPLPPIAGGARLPDPDQEPERVHRPGGRAARAGLAGAARVRARTLWRRGGGGGLVVGGAGRRGAGDGPARPAGADRVGQVVPLPAGVLGRGLAGDQRVAAGVLAGLRAGELSRRRTSGTSSRRRARRSPTRTTSCSKSGRRPASGRSSRWASRWSSGSATRSCRRRASTGRTRRRPPPVVELAGATDPSAPPESPGWLLACAGGGWLAVLAAGRARPDRRRRFRALGDPGGVVGAGRRAGGELWRGAGRSTGGLGGGGPGGRWST